MPDRYGLAFIEDDLSGRKINALLRSHLTDMYDTSPPESVHALDVTALQASDITFWSVWQQAHLVACGALRELSDVQGEIKSMRVETVDRGKGIGASVLSHILAVAEARSYSKLWLETGAMDYFVPARNLYARAGFHECEPFGDYEPDVNSVFMCRVL